MIIPYPFIGPTYKDRFRDSRQQRCANLIVKNDAIFRTPGLKKWVQAGTGPIRGMYDVNNTMFVISGDEAIAIDTAKNKTSYGNISTEDSRISFAFDGDSLLFVDGLYGYVFDGTSVDQVNDADFPANPGFAAFADGYFVVNKTGTGQFYKSQNTFDPTVWAGELATAEQNPDNIVSLIEHRSDLWLMGPKSTEVWFYSGESFPWNPNRSAFQDYGIIAPHSISKLDNGLAWLAVSDQIDRVAVRTKGFQVTKISTPIIEREWESYTTVSDAFSYSFLYPGLGHFWVLTFPSQKKTWVYDVETDNWFEWQKYSPPNHDRHWSNSYLYFNGKHYVGDFFTGWIYEMDKDFYDDAGTSIHWELIGPELTKDRKKLFFNSFEVDLQAGLGIANGQGSSPLMYLSYSDTRGRTWSNPRQLSMGAAGGYTVRAKARRLGSSRSRVFKINGAEPIPMVFRNGLVDVDMGTT